MNFNRSESRRILRAGAVPILAMLLLVLVPGIALADDCASCHGSSGGYTFKHMTLSIKTDRVIGPNTEFVHRVVVNHPGKYTSSSVTVTVDLSGAPACICVDSKSQTLGTMTGGSKEVTFTLKAGKSDSPQKITTTLTYTAKYHYDPMKYTEVAEATLTLTRMLLRPNNWSMSIDKGGSYVLSLSALGPVTNVTLIPSEAFNAVASTDTESIGALQTGDSADITISGKRAGAGVLNIAYQDVNGTPYTMAIDVSIAESVAAAGWGLWGLIGFWVGITSLLLLMISALLGAPLKPLKAKVNKLLRTAKTRTAFHCGLSYMLLALALMHGVVVMSHWWSGIIWNDTLILAQVLDWRGYIVNLGVLSWVSMLLVSLGGAFYKPLTKAMSFNKWRLMHSGLTHIAALAALVHGIVHLYLRLTGG
jgi:hypothetical protein